MQLFQKFFNNLFYPFFIGLIITIVFVIVIINIYTFNIIDLKTSQNIISIEKKRSEISINTLTILLLNDLIKVQLGMHQDILLYEEIAKKLINSNLDNTTIQDYLFNYYDLKTMNLTDINLNNKINDTFRNETDFFSSWFVDQYTTKENLTDKNSTLYKQLLIYSYIVQSLYSFLTSTSDIVTSISFYFESTNLYITFPYDENRIMNNTEKLPWCTDENGNIFQVFNFKCSFIYEYIRISDDTICDINNMDQKNRTIFIFNAKRDTSPYYNEHYSFCIRFIDTLTNKSDIYLCADIKNNKIFNLFEDLNRRV